MKTNKGQAATEFLMTYGWALLVVLIAISTLAYFGVLSPGRFLPEKCTVDPGFACLDWIVDSAAGETTLVMKNSLGEDLTDVNVTMTNCNTTVIGSWNNGAEIQPVLTDCTGLTAGGSVNGDISYTYRKPSGLLHTGSGELITKAQ